ncbi:phytanoyl-CoA dioxygenase family protein [Tepidimonas taiwanensis]|uniref:Phytanoyl-CoA dioxygenase (PhyH) n=1 Tax=Tepidimonas taiwanensis TaxID=307486 RepID=A0A554WX46_9BURK|nr:phytanoyl-CoA dioxygenase family protein [Tepidimonas taiwanensis]TSE28153.1 Phytanoyl-CoA dioxygenase (PhyH) [Tepidimonas taiwanensis]UBQ06267.1 phytanoyl-CoA dioxygenase family protein [Tepidimonas taiwanensis]
MFVQTLHRNSEVNEVVMALRDDGCVKIGHFLDDDTLNELKSELLPALEKIDKGEDAFFLGDKTRRLSRLFARAPRSISKIALNPLFLDAARSILQANPVNVWIGEASYPVIPDIQISVTQAIQILPGQKAQPLHRDDANVLWRHPAYGREARVQIMVAISDFTEENGATRVIPGSHKWSDDRMPRVEEAVSAEMEPGDALLWLGSLYHGGGENRSNGPRTGVTIAYDLAFLRQEENQYLSIPIEVMKQFPEELQKLLGWTRSVTQNGWVEINGQMRDPLDLLHKKEFTDVGVF